MTVDEFVASLTNDQPPDVEPLLAALWQDAKGNWDLAHGLAQDIDTLSGAWVHAYLHRKEGDLANARYWYRRARQQEATDALESEWRRIVTAFLT
jgi:hypothetical protein